VAIEMPGNRRARRWAISFDDSVLTIRTDTEPSADETALVASAGTWLALLHGEANMAVELRARRLRLLDPPFDGPPDGQTDMSAVTHLLAHLTGLAGPAPVNPSPGGRKNSNGHQRTKTENLVEVGAKPQ
jgi:hypothetical protein